MQINTLPYPELPEPETRPLRNLSAVCGIDNLLRDSGPGGGGKFPSLANTNTLLVTVAPDKTQPNPTRGGVGMCADAGM